MEVASPTFSRVAPTFSRVAIGDLPAKEVREAVVVTQHPCPRYMHMFSTHKVYFLDPALGPVEPMQYVLCYEYEQNTKDEEGKLTISARHIRRWGKVKEILYDIRPDEYASIPELAALTQDNQFWPEIQQWENTYVVILESIGYFSTVLPFRGWQKPREYHNMTTTIDRVRNAAYMEDLFL